jgi:hypothetical protein
MGIKREPIERFMEKILIDQTSECWNWQACCTSQGYGRFRGKDRIMTLAHRWAYEHFNGTIPNGMCVCHTCDNPGCCNPDHLWLGTRAENVVDRDRKGRQAVGDRHGSRLFPNNRPRGMLHKNSKLSESQVVNILDEYQSGNFTLSDLARRYQVNMTTISRIIKRITWKHVRKEDDR